ncbi:hypothetical protein JCM11491_003624 [Sporobolomyces phaffii]
MRRPLIFHLPARLVGSVNVGRMNFSSLLNPDELVSAPFDARPGHDDAGLGSTRMSFDYLNSEENLSPAGGGSPAFFSTPSEFVGESDGEGMAYSMNQPDPFAHSYPDPNALLGPQHPLYDPVPPPSFSHYPQYPQFPTQPPQLSHPEPAFGQSDSSFPPFAFSPAQHVAEPLQHAPTYHASFANGLVFGPGPGDDRSKKGSSAKSRGKAKAKAKVEENGDSDGSGAAGPAKPSPRPGKSKGTAKSKRHSLLAPSNHTSPAPSPGPSSLANEVHFDSQEPEDHFERGTLPGSTLDKDEQEMKPAKPLTTTHLKAAIDPASASSLSSPFRDYVPPRIGPTGAVVSDSEDEDEDVARKRAQARRSATLAAKGKSRARIEDEDREQADDRLYCICRERYEPERMMIACDRCEEWYHIDCVKIPDTSVELVDQFFCPPCEKKYSQQTTWHPACARPTCRKAAITLSKYCSDFCGVSVVSARLELLKLANGTDPSTFWARVEGSHRKEAKVIDETAVVTSGSRTQDSRVDFQAVEDARTLARLAAKLEETNLRRTGLTAAISMVEKRLLYLQIAKQRWERLCQATADELANAGIDTSGAEPGSNVEAKPVGGKSRGKKKGKSGKKKGPVAATSLPEAQCGLDVRLVYDEETWRNWVDVEVVEVQGENGETREEPGGRSILAAHARGDAQEVLGMALEMLSGVCLETRKKCERHTGWQKLREADFQVEKAVLNRRLDRLNSLSQSLDSQISLHQQATAFRLSNHHRAASPSRLISVETFMEEQEVLRPRNKPGAGARRGRRSTSPIVNRGAASHATVSARRSDFVIGGGDDGEDTPDVPSELLPFLSRAEIARLKAQKK